MGIIPHIPFHSALVSRAPIVIPDGDDSDKTREELLAEVEALRVSFPEQAVTGIILNYVGSVKRKWRGF